MGVANDHAQSIMPTPRKDQMKQTVGRSVPGISLLPWRRVLELPTSLDTVETAVVGMAPPAGGHASATLGARIVITDIAPRLLRGTRAARLVVGAGRCHVGSPAQHLALMVPPY